VNLTREKRGEVKFSKKINRSFLPIDEYEKIIFSKYYFYDVKGESAGRQERVEMEINILIVFLAGMGTFLAPCIIPLVPSYLSYISGIVLGEEHNGKQKFKVILHTSFFILGFGTAFTALQILLFNFTNLASKLIGNNILNMIFGGIIIVMGLHMIGLFKITKLYSEKRMNFGFIKRNVGTSYLFGFAF